jgi:hypothetical protein
VRSYLILGYVYVLKLSPATFLWRYDDLADWCEG